MDRASAIVIRDAETDVDLLTVVMIRNASETRPWTVETLRADMAGADGRVLLASLDGRDAGAAIVAWSPIGAESKTVGMRIWVRPEDRHRGVGSALHAEMADFAAMRGIEHVVSGVMDGDSVSLEFAIRRGLTPSGSMQMGFLELTVDDQWAAPGPLPDIQVVTFADRPDLARGAYELDALVTPEIPALADEPVPSFDAWREETLGAHGIVPELSLLALREGRVVGEIMVVDDGDRTAFIALTLVHPAERRRGIARHLKQDLAARAARAGWRRLATLNDETNARIRGLNVALGYEYDRPRLNLRGPLLPATTDGPRTSP